MESTATILHPDLDAFYASVEHPKFNGDDRAGLLLPDCGLGQLMNNELSNDFWSISLPGSTRQLVRAQSGIVRHRMTGSRGEELSLSISLPHCSRQLTSTVAI
jgi:hypothetical protein